MRSRGTGRLAPVRILLASLGALLIAACSSAGPRAAPSPTGPRPADAPGPVESPPPDGMEAVADPTPRLPGVDLDTVRAERFDQGKMWTFEAPPVDYFRSEYGLTPDSAWLARARLAALRIPGCSASFVSRHGLVLTNHHCAREAVTQVSEDSEDLLGDGFFARTLAEERPVDDFEADQLITIVDVSEELDRRLANAPESSREERREEIHGEIEARLVEEFGGEDEGIVVEVISLYSGARTSAYVFRRYTDVRLVMAPELQIGFFGGDPDNFTYPRYNLDFAFLRVYDDEGQPLTSDPFFSWSEEGVEEGDAVFVIGNPGSTSRLETVAQLLSRRDVSDKAILDFVRRRAEIMEEYIRSNREESTKLDLQNAAFSLRNSEKAYEGQLAGLAEPVILARLRNRERSLLDSIAADSLRSERYDSLVDQMRDLQERKREVAAGYGAFLGLSIGGFAAPTLHRALLAFQWLGARRQAAPLSVRNELTQQILAVRDKPAELDEELIQDRLQSFVDLYGADDEMVVAVLDGRSPEGAASHVRSNSVLADSAGAAEALESESLSAEDPAILIVQRYLPALQAFQRVLREVGNTESSIGERIGRARYEIFGAAIPPDATFSLRVADGVVRTFEYNGTVAPPYTTLYGLYDRHYSHRAVFDSSGEDSPWALPERWLNPPENLDLSTPVNFVSTADIIGGNSGSPVVDRDLRLVGVVFDGNIESLPGSYIYLPESNRAVAVDARGILEALRSVYDMPELVAELATGVRVGG